jgi:drug/metabolite transporter (DMT)-like permease
VGFVGVAVMIGPRAFGGLGADALAELACLAAALLYGFAGVYGRRFRAMGVTPMQTAAGQITASAVLLAPIALIVERPWNLPVPGLPVWGAVLGIAILSTALAYVLFFRILATAGATNVMLVTFLVPVSAIVLGTLILGERLEAMQLVGMAIIGLGLAAIDGRPWRMLGGSAVSP